MFISMPQPSVIWFCAGIMACTMFSAEETSGAPSMPRQSGRVAWKTSGIQGTPDPPPPFQVEPAFPHLKFNRPLAITGAPGSRRLFVVEQAGKIYSFPDDSNISQADEVVDLKAVYPKLRAIYGLAFHPRFAENRYVFVTYVDNALDRDEGTRVVRFRMRDADPPTLDVSSERHLLSWRAGGHNGGCLKFGPDGYLYISSGDSGPASPPDELRAGQDLSNVLSSILRIDVDQEDEGRNYHIPADNPFVKTQNARGEIWAYGFRNPWKMSFDRQTGDLWVGDVGWELWELIHRVRKAGNYGWSVMEGRQPALPQQAQGPTPILPPTIDHPHSEAGSITGGFVYHGERLPDLKGAYIYGDYQSGIVWAARFDREQVISVNEIAHTPLKLVAFGENNSGELLLLDHTEQIYQLVPAPASDQSRDFPRKLSNTGLFADTRMQKPAPGVLPYTINAHHWADGTHSERWMAIPGTGKVTLNDKGSWIFPDGSVLAKTVSIDGVIAPKNPNGETSSVRLETQILHREAGTWRPYTYAWNPEQTDADLVDASGHDRDLLIRDATRPGRTRLQTYRFAARRECQLCHNPWVEARTTIFGVQSASPLAVNVSQLAGHHTFSDDSVEQLSALAQMELVDESVAATFDGVVPLCSPYDETAALDARARAWLHVNCAHCHQFNAGGAATISLAHDVPLVKTNTVSERPTQGRFQISGAQIVSPGDPCGSVLYYRVSKLGPGRMPRVGSVEVDVRGTRLIHDWIAAMSGEVPAPVQPDNVFQGLLVRLTESKSAQVGPIVSELLSTTRGALALLTHINAVGMAPKKMDSIVAATKDHSSVEIRDLFERFVPVGQRTRRLGATVDPAEILSLSADVSRGEGVFFSAGGAACSNCHQLRDKGKPIGPDLKQIGRKYSREKLLTHILQPSLLIEPKYVPWVVETTRGRILTGLLESESGSEVVLKDSQGKLIPIRRVDIEQMVQQQKSIMPELLLKDMTKQQVADLLAFLASLR